MKWTIRIEFASVAGDAPSLEAGSLTRTEPRDEFFGLTLEEGHQLLQSVERAIFENQAAFYRERRRPRSHCN